MATLEKLLQSIMSGVHDRNIQPDGNKAKPYQVKQIRNIILKYQMEVK